MIKNPAQISPRQTVDSGRQSSGAKGRRDPAPEAPARARKKSWPILEVVIFLLLVKITVGAAYFWSRSSAPAPSEEAASLMTAAAALTAGAESAAPAPQDTPPASAAAEPGRVASLVDGYLSVVSPAAAEAQASVLPASSTSVSAVSAGAMMVIGGQAAAPAAAQAAPNAIPLPPGGNDLLQPTVGSPAPAAPRTAVGQPSLQDQAEQARLRAREQDLARREAVLNTREEALTTLEAELNRRLSVIDNSRSELEGLVSRNEAVLAEQKAQAEQQQKEAETLRDARIQHLVTAYGGMKPDQAGALVNSLDDDVAVSILASMPGRKAGQILAFVDPGKAARLTKAISEMRIDPNLLLEDAANQEAAQ